MTEDLGDSPDDPILCIAQTEQHPGLTQMVVFQSTLDSKLLKHQELTAAGHGLDEIVETFCQPLAVYDGNRPGTTYVHVSDTHHFMEHPLVVVAIRVNESTSARFASAYYTSAFSSRTPIWVKGDSNA